MGSLYLSACEILQDIDLSPLRYIENIPNNFLDRCRALKISHLTHFASVISVGNYFFSNCKLLKYVYDFPNWDKIKSVGIGFLLGAQRSDSVTALLKAAAEVKARGAADSSIVVAAAPSAAPSGDTPGTVGTMPPEPLVDTGSPAGAPGSGTVSGHHAEEGAEASGNSVPMGDGLTAEGPRFNPAVPVLDTIGTVRLDPDPVHPERPQGPRDDAGPQESPTVRTPLLNPEERAARDRASGKDTGRKSCCSIL